MENGLHCEYKYCNVPLCFLTCIRDSAFPLFAEGQIPQPSSKFLLPMCWDRQPASGQSSCPVITLEYRCYASTARRQCSALREALSQGYSAYNFGHAVYTDHGGMVEPE